MHFLITIKKIKTNNQQNNLTYLSHWNWFLQQSKEHFADIEFTTLIQDYDLWAKGN